MLQSVWQHVAATCGPEMLPRQWKSEVMMYTNQWKSTAYIQILVFFFQDLAFVDTLVSLIGVVIECLDFSTPGLFAMATTAAGKSPNTTPTKWNKRLQRPMGNLTSVVTMASKLLSACERTSNSKVKLFTYGQSFIFFSLF